MHDPAYKHLFSHPRMVEDLLTGFVRQPWVEHLDFSTLEKLNQSYVSDDLRERADDVVWRVRYGTDEWLYVYVLLEFQSTVDPYMAVRLLTYVGLLYQDLIKSGRLGGNPRLPPVFPVVLYNGDRPWTAAQSLGDLIQPSPEGLRSYQPELHYWLLDERSEPAPELDDQRRNLVAALLRAEQSAVPQELGHVVARLVTWLEAPEQLTLRRAFVEWLTRVVLPLRMPGQRIEPIRDLMEMQTMLAERVKDWTREWKLQGLEEGRKIGREEGREVGLEEGREEGREVGREEGREEGEATVLKRLLALRFGPLPEWALQRLDEAKAPQLEAWADRFLEAQSLEQFFA